MERTAIEYKQQSIASGEWIHTLYDPYDKQETNLMQLASSVKDESTSICRTLTCLCGNCYETNGIVIAFTRKVAYLESSMRPVSR